MGLMCVRVDRTINLFYELLESYSMNISMHGMKMDLLNGRACFGDWLSLQ